MMNSRKEALLRHWTKEQVITDQHVLNAFKKVPREKFVLPKYKDEAYHDYPLPIPAEQTISQPTTVLIMTENLRVEKGQKILEVGTGSGYQAALLSVLVGNKGKIITTEVVPELFEFALKNLKSYKNVQIMKVTQESLGYKKEAPYDRIIVTAALPEIPQTLYEQLKEGGIIVAPVGSEYSQELFAVEKIRKSLVNMKRLGMFQFVPVRGRYGF